MRTLTIKRAKKYVAWMSKVKVYIEDPVSGDTIINDVPCRKIGDLKNGQEKSFTIGNDAARVFVIGDKLSRNICNDFFELPAGEEDIYLTGQNKYNLLNYNAFIFDNNASEQALLNRKKNKKKGLLVLIVAALVGFGFGFMSAFTEAEPIEKTFSADGMSIILTDEFHDIGADGYNAAFATEDVVVFALKEEFAIYEGIEEYTIEEYGELIFENNEMTDSELASENGLTYFTYDSQLEDSEEVYSYKAYIFKADDAFWLIQFATSVEDSEAYSMQIEQWASTISFSE